MQYIQMVCNSKLACALHVILAGVKKKTRDLRNKEMYCSSRRALEAMNSLNLPYPVVRKDHSCWMSVHVGIME